MAEIARRGLTDVLLWGHSSGTALAVATARALEARGVPVRRVFLGAQLLGDADRRRAAMAELYGQTDADIAARLAADGGYTALGELDAQRAGHVGAAYRHDCLSAHRYFLDALDIPPAPMAAPITVVVAADDPSTADFARRHREWRLLADEVDLHELADGGHYFLRTRPAEAAESCCSVTDRGRPAPDHDLARRLPVVTGPIDRKDIPMSSSVSASPFQVLQAPRRPPLLPVTAAGDPARWAAAHRDALRATVLEHGALLVRGLGLRDAAAVGAVFRALAGSGLMAEREAFAPRADLRRGRVLLDEVAGQPADVHAPRAELHVAVPRHDDVRLPHRARPGRGDGGGRLADRAQQPAAGAGGPVRAGRLDAHPHLRRGDRCGLDRGVRHRQPGRGGALLPGQRHRVRLAARRWAAHPAAAQRDRAAPGDRAAVLVQPDRLPQPVDARPRTCASTWSRSTARTGCRSTPASATATRSVRTSCEMLNGIYEATHGPRAVAAR